MTTIKPVYRLTIYAPRSVDPTESTPLTPVVGSWHSDAFKVATAQGITGFKGYMNDPMGDRGSFSMPAFKMEVGRYRVRLIDKRNDGDQSNLTRWVTAFVGNSVGAIRLKGRLAMIEESLDNGVTWNANGAPFFVGRVSDFSLDDPLNYSVDIRNSIEDLKGDWFTDRPAVSYVTYQYALPIGLSKPYDSVPAAIPLTGVIKPYLGSATNPYIVLDQTSIKRLDNIVTQDLVDTIGNAFGGNWNWTSRAIVNNLTTGQSGEFIVYNVPNERVNDRYAANSLVIGPLDAADVNYLPLTALHTNDNVNVVVYRSLFKDGDGKQQAFFFTNIDPLQVWKDGLDGKFSRLYNGVPINTVSYDTASFNALSATGTVPIGRFKIEKSYQGIDFIETVLCRPYSLGFRIEPRFISGSIPRAQVVPFSTALPTTLPSVTITSDDVVTSTDPTWTPGDPIQQFSITYYDDYSPELTDERKKATDVWANIDAIKSVSYVKMPLDISDPDAPYNTFSIDALGVRGLLVTLGNGSYDMNFYGQNHSTWAERTADGLLNPYRQRFTIGAPTVELECRRTANVNGLQVGDWVLVNLDILPNSFTRLRGGTRMFQVLKKSENGLTQTLSLLDSSKNVVIGAPTVGALTAATSSVSFPVTVPLVGGALVNIQYAITATTTGSISSTSPLWTQSDYTGSASGSTTYTIDRLPSGTRVFVRARTETLTTSDTQLPSAWITPVTASAQLPIIAPPTALTVSSITAKSAALSWTNGSSVYGVEVLLASPSTASLQSIARLLPGSTTYIVNGLNLNPSTVHMAGVRHFDAFSGTSTTTTSSFTASGTNTTLPALGGFFVYLAG